MAQNFINGILIPEDGEPRRVALETDGRGLMGDALSRLVGGCFDTLPIVIPGVDLWVNDDGTSEFGPNRAIYATRAMEERGCLSQIDYRHVPAEGELYTILHGQIVALGFDPDSGASVSLTEEQAETVVRRGHAIHERTMSMGEEMKGTTRYLDATVMEYALLDHARLRTPYGTQDDVRAYAAGGEKAALHDLALALADMASRTGISWTASDTAPTFRDGGTEAYVELRRDQPNGPYSHLDAEAYLCTADGPRCIARLNLTEPGDIPSTVSGADGLASRIADRLNHPQFPKAGAYGPTADRMGDWYRGVEERFAAMSEENRRTRAIEPDEEAYHVGTGMYVTAEQFADVLPSPLLANRFVIMSFGYDADQASLHWNDMDYWSDEAAETAITDGDEDGCYWTGCMWDEDDYPDRLETPGMEESARPGGKTI